MLNYTCLDKYLHFLSTLREWCGNGMRGSEYLSSPPYTTFSFQALQTMSNFIQPVIAHIGWQVSAFHHFARGLRPLECGFHITLLVLVIFRHLDIGIDMTFCRGFFPESNRLIEISTSLLQDRQALHNQAEICLRYTELESVLEQARGFIPATQILEQFTKRNKVKSVLHVAAIRVLYHLINMCQ